MPKPTTAKTYPHFATYRDDEDGMDIAKGLAKGRGCSISALLRALVREELARLTQRTARTAAPKETQE